MSLKNGLRYMLLIIAITVMTAVAGVTTASATTYIIETNGDSFINANNDTDTNRNKKSYGGSVYLGVNRGGSVTNNQKAYIRFEHRSIGNADAADIKLQFQVYQGSSVPDNEGVRVYGLNGDQSVHDWVEGERNGAIDTNGLEMCWNNAPGNNTSNNDTVNTSSLGKLTVDSGLVAPGQIKTLSGNNLGNYIRGQSGPKATFIITTSVNNVVNLRIASKENTSGYLKPTLITTIPAIDPLVAITASAAGYIIDNNSKTITIPNTDTKDSFLANIAVTGSAAKALYTDSTLLTLAGADVHNGMVLGVTAQDGTTTVKEYYTVIIENEMIGPIQTTINGQPAETILTAGTVAATVPLQNYRTAQMPVTLILAKYKEGQLLECKLDACTINADNPTATLSASLDVEDTGGVTVKAMLWNGTEGMEPYFEPKILQ